MEKWIIRGGIAFVILLVVGFIYGLVNIILVEQRYNEWAKQCNDAGYVIVDTGHYHHCMSWDEAKEKGVEFKTG